MNRVQYEATKQDRLQSAWTPRAFCLQCRKPKVTCYCSFLKPFQSNPEFVILIHRMEAFRKIATGRMSHQCISNSSLFVGTDFTLHPQVNAILADPTLYPVVLYPAINAVNLTPLTLEERRNCFPADKRLVVFVLDATWAQAKRMRRLSKNLLTLPTLCFTPPKESAFIVRKQPKANCYSTIESIHHIIDLLDPGTEAHEILLDVFYKMVSQQIAFGARKLQRRGIRPRLSSIPLDQSPPNPTLCIE